MKKKSYANNKVLITGGAGFIGSNLAISLVDQGAIVTIVDSMIPDLGGNDENLKDIYDSITFDKSDLRDTDKINKLVRDQDVIFHLAGSVSHIDSMLNPKLDLALNTEATISLLEAVRHNNPTARIVFSSTRQIYGKPQYLPVDENHPISPTDTNGIHKQAAEEYMSLYHKVYGLKTVSLRLTNTYGPRQLVKHNRQGFISWFVRQIIEDKPITIYGDGSQRRDLTYVNDVVEALMLSGSETKAIGKVYNLAHPNPISLKDLVELMIKVAGQGSYTLIPWPAEKKKIDIGDYYGSSEKISKELGWTAKTSLKDGLKVMLDFYQKNGAKYGIPKS